MAELTKVVSVRLPERIIEYLEENGHNVTETIKDLMERTYSGGIRPPSVTCVDIGGVETLFPIGDVVCKDTNPQSQLWWCNESGLKELTLLSTEWEKNGFKLCVGVENGGSWSVPEVITEPIQERRNGGYCVNSKMVGAYVGDKLVWYDIVDSAKALAFMVEHTNIPCAPRCDVKRYNADTTYKQAFDRANELFIHYFINGHGQRVGRLSESEMAEIFDL